MWTPFSGKAYVNPNGEKYHSRKDAKQNQLSAISLGQVAGKRRSQFSTESQAPSSKWGGMRAENRELKIEKEPKKDPDALRLRYRFAF